MNINTKWHCGISAYMKIIAMFHLRLETSLLTKYAQSQSCKYTGDRPEC